MYHVLTYGYSRIHKKPMQTLKALTRQATLLVFAIMWNFCKLAYLSKFMLTLSLHKKICLQSSIYHQVLIRNSMHKCSQSRFCAFVTAGLSLSWSHMSKGMFILFILLLLLFVFLTSLI